MSKRRSKTADEFLAEQRRDVTFHRRAEAQQRALAMEEQRRTTLEAPILARLAHEGYPAESLHDFVHKFAPLSADVITILLAALKAAAEPDLQETLVRTLSTSGVPFPGTELMTLFDATLSESRRWAIANTLSTGRPLIDHQWLIDRVTDPAQGRAREMLLLALERVVPAAQALPVLRSMLPKMPGHVALSLAHIGTAEDIPLLQAQAPTAKPWERKELAKAIKRIERRSSRNAEDR